MAAKKKNLGFEQQLASLEALVESLESGELDLEEGVEKYKEGVELLKKLNLTLASAENKVEELTATLRAEIQELESGGKNLDADSI